MKPKEASLVPQRRGRFVFAVLLFFLSGFAALVYQVLWVRQLGLLFGNTAEASALTIAIFFAGLSTGGWFWGARAPYGDEALRWFGLIEIGVSVTALGHFALLGLYHAAYPLVYGAFGHVPLLDLGAKIAIAALVLFPPAFLMGGTLPLMGGHLIQSIDRLGRTGPILYAVNTAGSACGAVAAGFFLPTLLGFQLAYLLAVGIDLSVGLVAVLVATLAVRRSAASRPPSGEAAGAKHGPKIPRPGGMEPAPTEPAPIESALGASPAPSAPGAREAGIPSAPSIPRPVVWLIAFASGFATLGIEVIWTRLFSQVLQNSVYTYAIVLTSFLLALAAGAVPAHALSRLRRVSPRQVVPALLAVAAAVTAISPWLFFERTGGLAYLGGAHDWSGYVLTVFGVAAVVMFLPAVILGTILPYLMRALEQRGEAPARMVGRLVAVDTLGAILGSLTAGFVILPLVGAVRGLLLLSGVYLLALTVFVISGRGRVRALIPAAAIGAFVVFVSADPLQQLGRDIGGGAGGRVVEMREGSAANVAVVDVGDGLAIRVNTYYTLGSSRALQSERNQTVIPMLLHPEPDSVFFLGMGTGITAGASLSFPVTDVTVCEIIEDVIDLAVEHFDPYVNGLFGDPRVTIYAEDGRTCLSRSPARYDVVISDLFTPWKAGTGNLYTLDHYRTAARRLNDGGIFVQWIPLYQVSQEEFGIIARTMMEAFPEVTLWRGDLFPSRSIVALVGRNEPRPLDPAVIQENARVVFERQARSSAPEFFDAQLLRFYAGNITESGLFDDYPINTDTYPLVEYLAPRTHRAVRAGEACFMTGFERQVLYRDLRRALPPARDPYLARLTEAQLGYVTAGFNYTYYNLYSHLSRPDDASPFLDTYLAFIPSSISRRFSPAAELIGE